VEKYCRAWRVTDDYMAHAHCMLDTYGIKYTHSDCIILVAFPLQQRLHLRATISHNVYIASLAIFKVGSLSDVIIVLSGMDVCNHIQLIAVCSTDAYSRTVLFCGGSFFCVSRLSSSTVCHLLMTELFPFFSIPSHFKTFTHFTLTKFLT
jgi:hypothetical protein